jgi:hypothetical protein
MKKIVITFGVISGVVSSALMIGMLGLIDRIGFDYGEIVGYSMMVLSFLLVFFGIRAYRENVGHGSISFLRGLAVGMLIVVISTAFYVGTWEIIYFKFMPDFGEKYAAHVVEQARKSGATQQALDAKVKEMKEFKAMYDKPLFNVAFTFLEPLPVGLIMTLLSAAILRKKPKVEDVEESQTQTPGVSFGGFPSGAAERRID